MNKKDLSERDICTKFITPALEKAGWDVTTQIREEFPLTRGRIIVRGKLRIRPHAPFFSLTLSALKRYSANQFINEKRKAWFMNMYVTAGKSIIGLGILVFALVIGGCAHTKQFVPQPALTGPACSTNDFRICFAIESDARDWMVSYFGTECPYAMFCNGKNIAVMKMGSFVVWDHPVSSVDKAAKISVSFRNGGLKSFNHTLPVEAGRVSRLILKFGLTRASFRELDATEWEKICSEYDAATYNALK